MSVDLTGVGFVTPQTLKTTEIRAMFASGGALAAAGAYAAWTAQAPWLGRCLDQPSLMHCPLCWSAAALLAAALAPWPRRRIVAAA